MRLLALCMMLPLGACTASASGTLELGSGSSTEGGDTADEDGESTDAPADSSGAQTTLPGDTGEESSTGEEESDTMPDPPMWLGLSSGCGTQPSSIFNETIDVQGATREYILDLPADYDENKPYALVFGYHGYTETMTTAEWRFNVGQFWGSDAIGLYPNGTPQAAWGGAPGWEVGNPQSEDIDFFDQLATRAANELCIDLDRIFVMGFSNGGYFTHSLMCYRAPYVRAAAFGGAGLSGTAAQHDNCGGPVPAWGMHATNDDTVPYNYGASIRDFWLQENGCGGSTVPISPTEYCVEYQGCGEETPQVWCETTQGHWWDESWATPAAVAFLKRFGSPNSN